MRTPVAAPPLLLAALVACGGGQGGAPGQRPAGAGDRQGGPDDRAAPATQPAEPGLDEAAARRLLAMRFREAGLRIVEDVPVSGAGFELTADGFDPARGVGYEYVAAEEAGAELGAEERAALARDRQLRVLVIEAAGAGAIEEAASRFLAAPPAAPDQR